MAVVYTKKQKQNIIIRVILLIALLIVIVVCVAIIIDQNKVKKGLKEIKADTSKYISRESDYIMKYYLDSSNGKSISTNHNTLKKLYSESYDFIYELINDKEEFDNNIYYINNHINEEIIIDSLLYDYLKKIYDFNPYYLYLGPLYDFWFDRIYIIDRYQALQEDPINNIEIKNKIDYFINTSINNISIEFLEENKIKLNVNDNYKHIYDDDNIYINFNMFSEIIILDYISNSFIDNGYTNGYILTSNSNLVNFGYEYNIEVRLLSKEHKSGYSNLVLPLKSNYISTYDYKVLDGYPYYELENQKRSLFIDYNTGYSLDIKSAIFYDNNDLLSIMFDMIDYYNGNNISTKYILQYDNKVYTNTDLEFDMEVVYEA